MVSSSADPQATRRRDERRGALEQLIRVERGAYASRLLQLRGPGERARVLGVLRWLRTLDHLLQPVCRRPIRQLDDEVRWTLRIGLFEIAFLGVPPPVATDAAVRLVRSAGKGHASGLVNAVLRKAHPDWKGRWQQAPLAVRLAHPDWLLARWQERFGDANAERAVEADQEPAGLWAWCVDAMERSRLGGDLRPHPWCPEAVGAARDSTRLVASVRSGASYAQDPSSQLVAFLATAILARLGDSRVIHLCAAPGGKAARLASLRRCSRQVALDRHFGRTTLVSDLLQKVNPRAVVVNADATAPPVEAESWDLVMLDAPCTGTGTLRRHPELKWKLRPDDPEAMADLQRQLLRAASGLVAPGGVVLYSTCSVEWEENENVIRSLSGFRPVELKTELPPRTPAVATATGGVRLLPGADHDGFTVHALTRSSSDSRGPE